MSIKISYKENHVTIDNSDELFVAISITPPDADKEFFKQIGDRILDLIINDQDFLKILSHALGVKGQSKIPYLECFGNDLKKVVTESDTISRALALISLDEDQKYFLNKLGKENLRNCILSVEDISGCLEWLYGKMDTYFMNLIGWDYIIRFINTGEDLGIILTYLEENEEKQLIDIMGWQKVIDNIKTSQDLYYVLSGMNEGNEKYLINLLTKEKIKEIIPFEKYLNEICKKYLSKDSAKILKEKYE